MKISAKHAAFLEAWVAAVNGWPETVPKALADRADAVGKAADLRQAKAAARSVVHHARLHGCNRAAAVWEKVVEQ